MSRGFAGGLTRADLGHATGDALNDQAQGHNQDYQHLPKLTQIATFLPRSHKQSKKSRKYTNKLTNTRILIFGGTSGIGFCIAENALENGATVIVSSSQQFSVDKAISRLQSSYPELIPYVSGHTAGLRSDSAETSILALLKFATNDGKDPLDHIAFTAGDSLAIQSLDRFEGADSLADAMRVRLAAPLFVAKHAPGTYLRISSRSSITLTGGVNTYRPGKNWWLIALVSGALDGAVRGLAVDLKPIRVNVVAPGAVETELMGRSFGGDREKYEEMIRGFRDGTLVGEVGRPEDMSEGYVYAMRDEF